MPYCENCGSQINPNAKFCGTCGAAITKQSDVQPQPKTPEYNSPQPSPTPPSMPPPAQVPLITQSTEAAPRISSEAVVGVILFKKQKSFGRWDTFTGAVTNQRLIFAQMTSEMIKAAAQQSRDQAKAEGKGFFGQWADQLKATFGYTKKYLSMPPSAILAETPGNFELNNNTINEIKLKTRNNNNRDLNQNVVDEFNVEIHSIAGKYEFTMDENADFIKLLKQVYGERVKTPFGYFSKTLNIRF